MRTCSWLVCGVVAAIGFAGAPARVAGADPEGSGVQAPLWADGEVCDADVVASERPVELEALEAALFRGDPEGKKKECTPRDRCCKVCSKGKACGNSCIRADSTCRKGRGCACDAREICR